MGNPSLQDGNGTPKFSGSSVQLLGLIHLLTAWTAKAEQGVCLLLQGMAVIAGG